jgi:hypothetical protein
MICSDWPTNLKCDTAFKYIKGEDETDERQTRDRRIEDVRDTVYQRVEESRVAKL